MIGYGGEIPDVRFIWEKNLVMIMFSLTTIYLSFRNYLLFHSLVELVYMIIGFTITILAFNSHKLHINSQFVFLGISYSYICTISFIHILSYEDIGIFMNRNTNITVLLSQISLFMESVSILIASIFLNKKLKFRISAYIYTLVSMIIILTIFYWSILPVYYIEGIGHTKIKITTQIMTISIFVTAIFFLIKNNKKL